MATFPTLEKKYVKSKVADLRSSLQEAPSASQKGDVIRSYLAAVESDAEFLNLDTEFPPSLDWFNTPSPLSFAGQLQGKIVVLDFFTYCCINCIHVLPQLERLEHRHPVNKGVIVVGVHSAKFGNEKVSANIRNAISRYGISHPVVNDVEIELWERLGVTCWPTLVIVGPQRQLLYCIIGEGHEAEFQLFMDVAVKYYSEKGVLSEASIAVGAGEVEGGKGREGLRYPGKVCFDDSGEKLFVSDSSNHRVLMVEWKTGQVVEVFGSGKAGFQDGERTSAQFNSPQGLTYCKHILYVADTENHALRKVDLATGEVSTLAGTGSQGNDKEGGKVGVAQELSSPWDVEMGKAPGSEDYDIVYVAMAGTHQIWVHFLQDTVWTKGSHYPAGTTLRLSGSGDEANRNNSYPHKASFAQPSGLTLSPDHTLLYVADSESSTVRAVALPGGSVKALVGGAIDPLDLFAFGDKDGKGRDVRLQHPLGVACGGKEGVIYVADSYNHKIKCVSPGAKTCTTLAGTGSPGLVDGASEHAQFSEPGGLCLVPDGDKLVIADTNNHAIRVLELETRQTTKYEITFSNSPAKSQVGKKASKLTLDDVPVPANGEVDLRILITPPTSCHWTEGAPSTWKICQEENIPYSLVKGQQMKKLLSDEPEPVFTLVTDMKEGQFSELKIETVLYYCEDSSGVCHMQATVLCIPLVQSNSCTGKVSKSFNYSPILK